jgi:hypothetical protein
MASGYLFCDTLYEFGSGKNKIVYKARESATNPSPNIYWTYPIKRPSNTIGVPIDDIVVSVQQLIIGNNSKFLSAIQEIKRQTEMYNIDTGTPGDHITVPIYYAGFAYKDSENIIDSISSISNINQLHNKEGILIVYSGNCGISLVKYLYDTTDPKLIYTKLLQSIYRIPPNILLPDFKSHNICVKDDKINIIDFGDVIDTSDDEQEAVNIFHTAFLIIFCFYYPRNKINEEKKDISFVSNIIRVNDKFLKIDDFDRLIEIESSFWCNTVIWYFYISIFKTATIEDDRILTILKSTSKLPDLLKQIAIRILKYTFQDVLNYYTDNNSPYRLALYRKETQSYIIEFISQYNKLDGLHRDNKITDIYKDSSSYTTEYNEYYDYLYDVEPIPEPTLNIKQQNEISQKSERSKKSLSKNKPNKTLETIFKKYTRTPKGGRTRRNHSKPNYCNNKKTYKRKSQSK